MDIMLIVQKLKRGEKYNDCVRLTTPHTKKPPYYKMLSRPGQKAQWTGNIRNQEKQGLFQGPKDEIYE
jgi:hypothetical protein